ncbi:hypothetical protein CLV24_12217 [Pontibacter ummariensis]|uniref:Uncharacterized protein n=2 Tax=Pontibacter ummariensis TaxID=1610492 RepID=A0A239JIU3_9BACT|nr:hypothetical protein CLV24_12217 [Pontibacter ummariensis]SNT05502.1 hypothetical protein SAMN06296052_12217 [Pontibacter ummariensis]
MPVGSIGKRNIMRGIVYVFVLAGLFCLASCDRPGEERAEELDERAEELTDEAEERTDKMDELEDEIDTTAVIVE